jgi:hypothetical protein
LRGSSEKDAKATQPIKGLDHAPTFSTLLAIESRFVERLVKKGVISSEDEAYILHGEE